LTWDESKCETCENGVIGSKCTSEEECCGGKCIEKCETTFGGCYSCNPDTGTCEKCPDNQLSACCGDRCCEFCADDGKTCCGIGFDAEGSPVEDNPFVDRKLCAGSNGDTPFCCSEGKMCGENECVDCLADVHCNDINEPEGNECCKNKCYEACPSGQTRNADTCECECEASKKRCGDKCCEVCNDDRTGCKCTEEQLKNGYKDCGNACCPACNGKECAAGSRACELSLSYVNQSNWVGTKFGVPELVEINSCNSDEDVWSYKDLEGKGKGSTYCCDSFVVYEEGVSKEYCYENTGGFVEDNKCWGYAGMPVCVCEI